MDSSEVQTVSLSFGVGQRFACEIDPARLVAPPRDVPALTDLPAALAAALESPLDFPPLAQSVIPDDRVALAIDPAAPGLAEMVAAVWNVLQVRGVDPENVFIVQPSQPGVSEALDPRRGLPPHVAEKIHWKIHDPSKEADCAYVAATASGDRIYLCREVAEADVAISVGQVCFDPLIGCRGGHSVFYPALSTRDAIHRAQGQGHDELGPDDDRPLRQLMDEVGWLLGSQFSVQVVPSSRGGVAEVLAGAPDSVLKRGRSTLARLWMVELESRPDTVVAAVGRRPESDGWVEAGAALAACRRLVARGGRIVLLTDLSDPPGEGIQLIRTVESARDVLKPLRQLCPDDLIAATQFAQATDWARSYLFSRLESDLVEGLFFMPIDDVEDVQRLLNCDDTCLFLSDAQSIFGRISSE